MQLGTNRAFFHEGERLLKLYLFVCRLLLRNFSHDFRDVLNALRYPLSSDLVLPFHLKKLVRSLRVDLCWVKLIQVIYITFDPTCSFSMEKWEVCLFKVFQFMSVAH